MTTIAAVIWDMDGVLVDSGEFHYESWSSTLAEHGVPFSRETFRETFGMNNESILKLMLGEGYSVELLERIGGVKEARFREAIRGAIELLPGVRPLLEALHERGIPQAIGSSAPRANIDAIIEALEIAPCFDAIISAAEMPGKPDPTVFLTAARQLGIPPERCLVVEDAVAGVSAARRAGMKCLAVTTTNPAEALGEADLVIGRLDEIDADRLLAL